MSSPSWFQFAYRFHPAGQGIFASGDVEVKNPEERTYPYHWVFDCGSNAPRELAPKIEAYRRFVLPQNWLDLLTISHFDNDHVSGLSDLLKDLHIDTVVIPYYSDIERLWLGTKETSPSADYIAFLSNPVAFLLERAASIRRIIIVSNEDEGGPTLDRPPEPPPDEPVRSDGNPNWKLRLLREGVPARIPLDEATRDFAGNRWTEIAVQPQSFVAYASHPNCLWEFCFFHKPIDDAALMKLRGALNRVIDSAASGSNLKAVLKDRKERRRIRDVFKQDLPAPETINSTSLCVYSGPDRSRSHFWTMTAWPNNAVVPAYALHGLQDWRAAILYTGDANFSLPENRADVQQFLTPARWERIRILQVPHHGSRKNWEVGSQQEFPHQWSIFCADELHRKFGHPHREVLLDLMHRGPVLVNKQTGWTCQGTGPG